LVFLLSSIGPLVFLLSSIGPLVFLLPGPFELFPIILNFSVPDEDYSKRSCRVK
jgi:hypothetical protein